VNEDELLCKLEIAVVTGYCGCFRRDLGLLLGSLIKINEEKIIMKVGKMFLHCSDFLKF